MAAPWPGDNWKGGPARTPTGNERIEEPWIEGEPAGPVAGAAGEPMATGAQAEPVRLVDGIVTALLVLFSLREGILLLSRTRDVINCVLGTVAVAAALYGVWLSARIWRRP